MNTPFWNALASTPIQGTFKPKQTSQVLCLKLLMNQHLVVINIKLQKQLSQHIKTSNNSVAM